MKWMVESFWCCDVRFSRYLGYPYAVALLSREHNPDTYQEEILKFLSSEENVLDKAYSLPLHRTAHTHANMQAAHTFMLGDDVQDELSTVVKACTTSTLDVERSHNT
eukprot:1017948-Amphidinium_carterae.1